MAAADEVLNFGVDAPSRIFRVSKSKYPPMQFPPSEVQGAGRFDDSLNQSEVEEPHFGVLYCGESPASSFIEVLSALRGHLDTVSEIEHSTILDVEEREVASELLARARAAVSGRWLTDRSLTSANIQLNAPLFDLSNAGAVQLVRDRLSLSLLAMGLTDLDFSHVLGDNRSLTRAISRWLWTMTNASGEPLFSGIRYRSRFDPECICLALYENRFSVDGDIDTQPITSETPGLAEAASILRLHIA